MQRAKIWFDNLSTTNYLLRYRPDLLQYFSLLNPSHPQLKDQLVKNALRDFIPPAKTAKMPHEFHIEHVVPRVKDRGVLVEFTFDGKNPSALQEILSAIRKHLHTETKEAMAQADSKWNFSKIRAFIVKGEPFLEDLTSKTASTRVRIDFGTGGTTPSFESLYSNLRLFGRLTDLTFIAPKDGPKHAIAFFASLRGSASAKNCLNGMILDGCKLSLQYDPLMKTNAIWKFAVDHPRVTFPFLVTAALAFTYTVFDPIRVFFIESNLKSTFSLTPSLPSFLSSYVGGAKETMSKWIPETWTLSRKSQDSYDGAPADIAGREEVRTRIEAWLEEKPSNVMLVVGPKSYGKTRLVRSAVETKKYSLWIKCDSIINRSDHEILPKLASQVGYFPVLSFSWLTKILDALVSATTGQKTGLSTSIESEIRKVLQLTTVALTKIIVEQKEKRRLFQAADQDDAEVFVDYPVILITNFMDTLEQQQFNAGNPDNQVNSERLYELFAEWAGFLTNNEIAHVIFVSSGGQQAVGSGISGGRITKLFSKVLPNRSMEMVVFSDANKSDSISYLKQRLVLLRPDDQEYAKTLKTSPDLHDKLESVYKAIGGRLSDLDAFISRVKGGSTLDEALNELVARAELELRRYGLGELILPLETSDKTAGWSPSQFWYLVKQLNASSTPGEVKFEKIKHSSVFKGDDRPIHLMERADIISIVYDNGRPVAIKAAKPLYFSAMKKMVETGDQMLTYNIKLSKELYDQENKKIQELEKELSEIILSLQHSGLAVPKSIANVYKDESYWLGMVKQESKTISEIEQHPLIARYHFVATLVSEGQRKLEQYYVEMQKYKSQLAKLK